MPAHWPFENSVLLKKAVDTYNKRGMEGVLTLPVRYLLGVGPKDQEWLAAASLGTLGQMKELGDAMAADIGDTPAQVKKLKRIRDKAAAAVLALTT